MKSFQIQFNKIQKYIEKALCVWAFCIAAYHLFLAAFRYILPIIKFTSYVKWAGLGLLVVSLLYLIVTLLLSKETRIRSLEFLKNLCSLEQILLILLLLWFILSCLINQTYGYIRYFRAEDWHLFDTAVCVLILFPMSRALGEERAKKAITLLVHLVAITYSAFTIVCLWRIFHLEVLTFPSGEQAGVTAEVQLMLGQHPNLTGMIALTMLCLCTYMCISQEREIRVLYIVLTLVNLIVLYLTNSRAILVGGFVFVVFTVFFYLKSVLKNRKTLYQYGVSLLVSFFCGLLFWYGRSRFR